ncbi:hypothetical protein [Corynebacterium freiburgense]|uniref:hypothetical protein n=1 Tax=Corynebacterium freiburgense TaxID=556548 RepID=UPI0012EC0502|nr:hypothetical protein [Corynebacterium freiburgense]WJZ01667.1 hypothetical protein CFREI_01815 [Corynebacterium freiburgense]
MAFEHVGLGVLSKIKHLAASFYTIRARYAANLNDALMPRSSVPKNPHRIYGEQTEGGIIRLRKELITSGLYTGPV